MENEKLKFVGNQELQDLINSHVYRYLCSRKDKQGQDMLKEAERVFCTLRYAKGPSFVNKFQSLFFGAFSWGQYNSSSLSNYLLSDTETVKTLTLAALSEKMYVKKSS